MRCGSGRAASGAIGGNRPVTLSAFLLRGAIGGHGGKLSLRVCRVCVWVTRGACAVGDGLAPGVVPERPDPVTEGPKQGRGPSVRTRS